MGMLVAIAASYVFWLMTLLTESMFSDFASIITSLCSAGTVSLKLVSLDGIA